MQVLERDAGIGMLPRVCVIAHHVIWHRRGAKSEGH